MESLRPYGRVILVEDEFWTLEGLKLTFPWDEYRLRVEASYTNPQEGLEAILDLCPDVIVTDIMMPGLSGLELIQAVRAAGLDAEIIIISGYQDFSFVQEAMHYGVSDYCLKPIQSDAPHKVLRKIAHRLDEKVELQRRERWGIFNGLYANDVIGERVRKAFAWQHLHQHFTVAVAAEDKMPHDLYELISVAQVTTGQFSMTILDGLCYLLYNAPNENVTCAEDLPPELCEIPWASSCVHVGADKLHLAAEEAEIAYQTALWNGYEGSLSYRVLKTSIKNQWMGFFFRSIEGGNMPSVFALLDLFVEQAKKRFFMLSDWADFWHHLCTYMAYREGDALDSTNFFSLTWDELPLLAETPDLLIQLIKDDLKYLKGSDSRTPLDVVGEDGALEQIPRTFSTNQHIEEIVTFIQTHFVENITLQTLTDRFYLNPNYICSLFQNHLGVTFTSYLNAWRLEKACELITSSNVLLSDIAECVGFNDYSYFSRLFKRNYGVSPAKYRQSQDASSDQP